MQGRMAALSLLMLGGVMTAAAQTPAAPAAQETPQQMQREIEQLRQVVQQLQQRVQQLEATQGQSKAPAMRGTPNAAETLQQAVGTVSPSTAAAAPQTPASTTAPAQIAALTEAELSVLRAFEGTTINATIDGYYEYNYNAPIGRVNQLRAYDVASDSFSLNQADIILEHAAQPSEGKRLGVRIDLQYGQATGTTQGNPANEPRPSLYRNLFQAYGTYVAPTGKGLTVDFGKWASSLGVEGNYTKDQIDYSRSLWFTFLPFYHMGFRASYPISSKVMASYWLVNGTDQTESFTAFKSQDFTFVLQPNSTLNWQINYYFGQQTPDVTYGGFPAPGTTQTGLPTGDIYPTPNGREHIIDSYATWNATPRLEFVGEGDYVINRTYAESAPKHVDGGAAYLQYQLSKNWYAATRFEYMSDREGLFSSVAQALKENTVTARYHVADGFLTFLEWRRDYTNVPYFLTSTQGDLKTSQNTSTLGLVWWFGGKQGTW